MNPLAKIVKPDPQPAYVLLTIILTIFGVMLYRKAGADFPPAVRSGFHGIAVVFLVVAAILIVKFARGLIIDLQVNKVGVRAQGRVVKVEQREFHEKGMPQSQTWRVTFTYVDGLGVTHEQSVDEFDEETAKRFQKPGAVVNIRYHPDYPDQFRWLD
jgi:hypothetical protein